MLFVIIFQKYIVGLTFQDNSNTALLYGKNLCNRRAPVLLCNTDWEKLFLGCECPILHVSETFLTLAAPMLAADNVRFGISVPLSEQVGYSRLSSLIVCFQV